jgi:integrase
LCASKIVSKRKAPGGPPPELPFNVDDPSAWEAALGARGWGSLFLPVYTDKKTGQRKTASKWWLSWGHQGKRFKECTGTSDEKKAEEYRKAKYIEVHAGRMPWQPQPELTVRDLLGRAMLKARLKGRALHPIEEAHARLLGEPTKPKTDKPLTDYSKVARRRVAAVHLGHGPHMPADRVTEDVIDAYTSARIAQGYTPATVNRDLAQLKHAYMLAWKARDPYGNSLVRRVPNFEWLEESDPRRVFTNEAEHQAIRSRLPECLQGLADFHRVTGWRKTEPLRITMDRIDTVDGLILLDPKETKAKRWRDPWPYRLHPVLNAVVEKQLAMKRRLEVERGIIIRTLFFWEDGSPILEWDAQWRKACKGAGLPGRRIHDYRRAAARDALKATGDRKLARRLIGAKTDAIFDRYNVVEQEDVQDAVRKLARLQGDRGAVEQTVFPFEKKASG